MPNRARAATETGSSKAIMPRSTRGVFHFRGIAESEDLRVMVGQIGLRERDKDQTEADGADRELHLKALSFGAG